jgi:large subunit ribosomal protein L6e
MPAKAETTKQASASKKIGSSTREVPHHTEKAKKWYPAEDEPTPKKVS